MSETGATRVRAGFGLLCALLLFGTAAARAQLRLDVYVSGLSAPIGFVQDPSNPSVQYIIEQGGLVRVIQNGALLPTPFLNVSSLISCCGEQGLLGIAFPTDYATSGRFYVNYTNTAGNTVVARFLRSSTNPLGADPSSRLELRWGGASGVRYIPQPYANHNGGHLAFGPDGYLYIGMGDGGSGDDPEHRAQNPTTLLGKMLRINVGVPPSNPDGYVVPPGNPFQPGNALGALPEIWAFGLRNPWKFSFDSPTLGGTGAMFIGDVGQNSWEEVDHQPPGVGGRNYGWRNREGAHPNPHTLVGGNLPPVYLPLIDPIVEYPHPVGASVIGGVVYRGAAMRPTYRGRYFFGDLNGRVWSIGIVPLTGGEAAATPPVEHTDEFGGTGRTGLLSAIGTDAAGEMYFLNYSLGQVLKMMDAGSVWVPPASDFNRDHKPDLIWFHEGTHQLAAWNMGGVVGEKLLAGYLLSAPALPPGWQVVGSGDIDGDGNTDLFLQSDAGLLAACYFDGLIFRAGLVFSGVADPQWRVRAVGDFNHDRHPDLVWQNAGSGQVVFWLMNGVNHIGSGIPNIGSPGPDWIVFGTGDSNLDGERDLFWQNRTSGLLAVWRMIGTEYLGGLLLSASPDASWKAVATADLNQDGSTDIVFQHTSTLLAAWYLSGETVSFGALFNPQNVADPQWKIVGPR